jgi:hypothetical protein
MFTGAYGAPEDVKILTDTTSNGLRLIEVKFTTVSVVAASNPSHCVCDLHSTHTIENTHDSSQNHMHVFSGAMLVCLSHVAAPCKECAEFFVFKTWLFCQSAYIHSNIFEALYITYAHTHTHTHGEPSVHYLDAFTMWKAAICLMHVKLAFCLTCMLSCEACSMLSC